ncbi:MAG TPA: Uma2 family endonuclease [Planctomycetaceae bacterium]|nr:Uma2 family endonuclease [Planctomycetaceae bacterium]
MSTAVEASQTRLPPGIPPWPVKRFTVAEYEELVNSGVFDEDDNCELLEGWLVPKMTKNPLHDGTIDLLDGLLDEALPPGWHTRGQNAIVTSDSVPEPDLAVVRGSRGDYRIQHPKPGDIAVVIEVAHTTLRADRQKAAIYARAGIPEYWLVNLVDWQLERMTHPSSDGRYQQTDILTVNDAVPLVIAGSEVGQISLQDLLTPPT